MPEILSANAARSRFLQRGGDIGQHGEALVGDFGETAEHDDLFVGAADDHREDPRPDRRHHGSVSGEYAEIALDAGDVNLIDFSGEGELFRRDEIEVESGHVFGLCCCHPRA